MFRYFSSGNFTNICALTNRNCLLVSGKDSIPFLQGLITNQILNVRNKGGVYSAFLNSKGRTLYDCFVYHSEENSFLVEAEKEIIGSLETHLKRYILRSKVSVRQTDATVWQVWSTGEQQKQLHSMSFGDSIITIKDPRHQQMGLRFILAGDAQGFNYTNSST